MKSNNLIPMILMVFMVALMMGMGVFLLVKSTIFDENADNFCMENGYEKYMSYPLRCINFVNNTIIYKEFSSYDNVFYFEEEKVNE